MLASFEKNVFFSNETANAVISINNSACKHAIKEIEFQVTQIVSINGRWGFNKKWDILENKDKSRIEAHGGEITKTMQLNLGQITYTVDPMKKKKTGILSSTKVNRTPEEMFELS